MSAVSPSDVDWHPESCPRIDYAHFYGTDFAICLSCGSSGAPLPSPASPASLHTPVSLPPLSSESAFRLLRLEPGKFDEEVRCRVQLSDLRDDPFFNAVSYTWADESGDDRKLAEILLDGKPFRVTKNCDLALRRVRERGYAASVWIDAVCIDQSNDMERGHQVRLMPRIYEQATRVLMYIGEHDNNGRELFERFEAFLIAVNQSGGSKEISHSDGEAMWKALQERDYFTRLWILQEIALAKQAEVLCGGSSLEWKHIIDHGLGEHRIQSSLKDSILGFDRSIVAMPGNELFVLDGGRHAVCKDPRDKVYGLLGLVPGHRIGTIVADYEISVEQLYTSLAVELAQLHGWFAVLSRAGSMYQCLDSLPSWVPDWTCTARDRSMPNTNPRPACPEGDSVIMKKNTIRLNLFQSPTTPDQWFLPPSRDETAGIHMMYKKDGLLAFLQPPQISTIWRDERSFDRKSLKLHPLFMPFDNEFWGINSSLVLQPSQSPPGPNQEPECQTKVLHEMIQKTVTVFPVKQSIFPPLERREIKCIIYHKSDPLLVKDWLGRERDASRSAIMNALRQAYAEARNDVSREWTLQAENLWAEEYKDEMGMLESWQRKKRMSWKDDPANFKFWFDQFQMTSPSRHEAGGKYLIATKGEDFDFEMNDLFWRLSVRRFAVRAQLVDIV